MKKEDISLIVPMVLDRDLSNNSNASTSMSFEPESADTYQWEVFKTTEFKIMFPSEWSVSQWYLKYLEEDIYTFKSEKGVCSLDLFFIKKAEAKGNITEDEFFGIKDYLIAKILNQNGYQIYENEVETKIDGKIAYRIIFEINKYEEKNQIEYIVFAYKEDKLFMMFFYDQKSDFSHSSEIVERMLASFEFLY